MEFILNDVEVRILGCLVEKECTTPDYYPMTLNALTNACNQKSNRNPVVSFEDTIVFRGLESLQEKGLTEKLIKADSRVPKYRHHMREKMNLSGGETAVLSELMLRGPQTGGEIRSRADRMHKFNGLEEVEGILTRLMERERPLVVKLPRQMGQKERRYMHLIAGEPNIEETDPAISEEPAAVKVRSENERIARLEQSVAELRSELDAMKNDVEEFKKQFD